MPSQHCPMAQTGMQHSTSFLDSLILVLDLLQLTSQWPIHIYGHVCGGVAVSSTISMVILSIKSSLGVCLKRWVVGFTRLTAGKHGLVSPCCFDISDCCRIGGEHTQLPRLWNRVNCGSRRCHSLLCLRLFMYVYMYV